MSETPPFTAQAVREMVHISECGCGQSEPDETGFACSFCRRRAMLDAFAQRLEQEEQQQTAFAATEGAAYAIVPHGAAEALREEGRREILREIAKLGDPCDAQMSCVGCGHTIGHKPSCLFLRAQQARQTPETP